MALTLAATLTISLTVAQACCSSAIALSLALASPSPSPSPSLSPQPPPQLSLTHLTPTHTLSVAHAHQPSVDRRLVHTLLGDAWSANMYVVMDAVDGSFTWIWFCLLAAVGNFILVQLFLAVISDSFAANETERKAREEAEAVKRAAEEAAEAAARVRRASVAAEAEVVRRASIQIGRGPGALEGDDDPLLVGGSADGDGSAGADGQGGASATAPWLLQPVTDMVNSEWFNNASLGTVLRLHLPAAWQVVHSASGC